LCCRKKRPLGRLTRPNKADAGRILKGKEENRKKQKHQNRERGRRGQTINLVTKLETAKNFSKIRSIYLVVIPYVTTLFYPVVNCIISRVVV
jgi:hypothetical protein